MKRRTRLKIALVLAVPLCLALAWVGHAAWTDGPTKLEIAKYIRNAWGLVSLPIWQINQPGTARSVQWIDWAGNPRFAVTTTSQIVLDKTTGLVWTRSVDIAGQTMTWRSARDFCFKHSAGNVRGFRLPSVSEMSTLFDAGGNLPPGTAGLWVDTPTDPADGFWTSTVALRGTDAISLDEGQAELDSFDAWTYASSQSGAIDGDFLYTPADGETHTVTWRLGIDEPGIYDVYVFLPHTGGGDVDLTLAAGAEFEVFGGSGPVVTISVDQSINQGKWHHWGSMDFVAGNTAYVRLYNAADGAVVADAVRVTPAGMPPVTIGDPWGDGTNFRIYSIKNVFEDPGGELAFDSNGKGPGRIWAVRGGPY